MDAEAPKSPSIKSAAKEPSLIDTPVDKEPPSELESIRSQKVTPPSGSPRTSVGASSPTTKASVDISNKSAKSASLPRSEQKSPKSLSIKSNNTEQVIKEAISNLEPQGNSLSDRVSELTEAVIKIAQDPDPQPNTITNNIDKISTMTKELTNEANALRDTIKTLTEDIARTKQDLCYCATEDVNFPYHLFLIEMIINKIYMKCECFDIDYNNLVISAQFLGKQPIVLYDQSFGKIDNFDKVNVGKSTLFAMTYDKISAIKEFVIHLQLKKQPPCSTCVTNIGETHMDYTSEFITLREELCKKWTEEQPTDNIICATSTPLSKNMYYVYFGDSENKDSIGIIEVTVRMSFLGKEITTAFCASPKPQETSFLLKEGNGMAMYSCQRVEMDARGKVLLDEGVLSKKDSPSYTGASPSRRYECPQSQISSVASKRSYEVAPYNNNKYDEMPRYDEILTKMNKNELRIRVPKTSKIERTGKYDRIQELCSCESTPYNTGEQIQFELPKDYSHCENTYTSNFKYTCKGIDKSLDRKDRKVINVTPTNCSVPVDMEKVIHPQKDVFILKIGKKLETKDKKTDLEIELVTPKAPMDKPLENNNISQQCSAGDLKKPPKEREVKGKSKKRKGGKEKRGKEKKGKGKKK